MKKLCLLLAVLVLVLSACSNEHAAETPLPEDSPEYSFSLSPYYPKEPHTDISNPIAAENKIVFCDQVNLFGGSRTGTGNVYLYDRASETEKAYDIFANGLYYQDGCIYYSSGRTLVKTDLETGETTELFAFLEEGPCGFLSGGEGYVISFEGNGDYSEVKLYSYDIEKEKQSLIVETNYLESPFKTFKVHNKYISYIRLSGKEYEIHSLSLETEKDKLIFTNDFQPDQTVFDGNALVWSDHLGVHCFSGGEDKIIGDGNSDVDILGGRYILYLGKEDSQIYVYDTVSESLAFSSKGMFDGGFSWSCPSGENTGSLAFVYSDLEKVKELYPDWNYEDDSQSAAFPEFIYVLDLTEK